MQDLGKHIPARLQTAPQPWSRLQSLWHAGDACQPQGARAVMDRQLPGESLLCAGPVAPGSVQSQDG